MPRLGAIGIGGGNGLKSSGIYKAEKKRRVWRASIWMCSPDGRPLERASDWVEYPSVAVRWAAETFCLIMVIWVKRAP
jgi:hypothetical protein